MKSREIESVKKTTFSKIKYENKNNSRNMKNFARTQFLFMLRNWDFSITCPKFWEQIFVAHSDAKH